MLFSLHFINLLLTKLNEIIKEYNITIELTADKGKESLYAEIKSEKVDGLIFVEKEGKNIEVYIFLSLPISFCELYTVNPNMEGIAENIAQIVRKQLKEVF